MVNFIKKIISFLIILSLCLTACASKDSPKPKTTNKNLVEVSTRIHLSKWNTKGIGESQPSGTLLINPEDFETDKVTIIRLSQSGEIKEVYHKDKEIPSDDTWVHKTSSDEEKTLTHQFKTTYMITELIQGENGGALSERFEVPKE